MLSDEEKKAIDKFKRSANYFVMPIYETKIILELIEKQSKEIEELKKQDLSNSKIIANMSTRHFNDREKIRKYEALQDKIKAKIEELDDFNSPFAQRVIKFKEVYLTEMVQNILKSLLEDNTEEIEETNLYYVTCENDFKNMNIVKILNEFFEKNNLIVNELVRAVKKLGGIKND